MNEYVILAIVLSIVLPISCFFLLRYLEGYYSILSVEEISTKEYNTAKPDIFIGKYVPTGTVRRIVYKYTYENKRIKFVTKEFDV